MGLSFYIPIQCGKLAFIKCKMESPADEVFAVGNQPAKTEGPPTGPNYDREKMISEDKQISEIIIILRLGL
jgi:hypothetical protein